jgi:predicted Zn-ribbon and HTH transcriptional regulator
MTIIVHADKSNSFLCIKSFHDKFIEGQLYSRDQIMRPLLNMLKRSSWIVSEEEYKDIHHVLKISNNNMTLLFVPIVCHKCFPKFDDDIPIVRNWELDEKWLLCKRCENTWYEESYEFVVGTIPHKRLNTF